VRSIKSIEHGEVSFGLDLANGILKVGQETYRCGDDHVILEERRVPFWVHRENQSVSVWLEGEVYSFQIDDPRHRSSAQAGGAAAGGSVKAQMPGKILQVSVKVGDSVEAGANLILMESMKMELAMDAPVAGVVTRVEVSPEQMVSQGDLLVEIEEQ
jgi:biotin carboxyl carrier protein